MKHARLSLPRTVLVLGGVSLLNDAASEMIAPLLPVLLTTTLGAGPAVIGLVEGVAQASASVLKLMAGRWTDRGARPWRLIFAGYALSNLVRPLIGLAGSWGVVLGLRFLDRIGKGLRTTPRDALLTAVSDASLRGRAFGLHRAMDHLGAVLGPLLAAALLARGATMRVIFLWSAVPGVLLMLLIFAGVPRVALSTSVAAAAPLRWRALDRRLRGLVMAAALLAFTGVPDAFLVLWAHGAGVSTAALPLLWAGAHALRALAAGWGGTLSDRLGRTTFLAAGWGGRVLLLVVSTQVNGLVQVWLLFTTYCAFTALTEPVEAALVGDRAPPRLRASALGLYHMSTGVSALPGAFLFGALWQWWSEAGAFLVAAVGTALAGLVFAWASCDSAAARA